MKRIITLLLIIWSCSLYSEIYNFDSIIAGSHFSSKEELLNSSFLPDNKTMIMLRMLFILQESNLRI